MPIMAKNPCIPGLVLENRLFLWGVYLWDLRNNRKIQIVPLKRAGKKLYNYKFAVLLTSLAFWVRKNLKNSLKQGIFF